MKIFFAGSVRGGRKDVHTYKEIFELLTSYGELFGEFNADKDLEEKERKSEISDEEIYTSDIKLISQCDVFIAEVSTPSSGVGYEVGLAESLNKRILCLFRKDKGKKLSAMINGNRKIMILEYKTIQDLKSKLRDFFST